MRFTLRDLFWLTLVVGLGLGWWVDRRQLAIYLDTQTGLLEQAWADGDVLRRQIERRYNLGPKPTYEQP